MSTYLTILLEETTLICPFNPKHKCYIPEDQRVCSLCKIFKDTKQTLLFTDGTKIPPPKKRKPTLIRITYGKWKTNNENEEEQ